MTRRALTDPVVGLLALVAIGLTVTAVASTGAVTAADACLEDSQPLLIQCGGGPDRSHLLTMALLALIGGVLMIAAAGALAGAVVFAVVVLL